MGGWVRASSHPPPPVVLEQWCVWSVQGLRDSFLTRCSAKLSPGTRLPPQAPSCCPGSLQMLWCSLSAQRLLACPLSASPSASVPPPPFGICGPAEASGQNHPHQAHRHQQGAPLSQDLPPQGERGDRVRRTHSHSPSPAPSSTPSLQQHAPPPPNAPQGRKNGEGGEETGQGERAEQREVTG